MPDAPTAPLPVEPTRSPRRYSAPSIIFHWLIAALIVGQVILGWWMNEWTPDHSALQRRIELVHVEVGLTILLLVFARIAARFAARAPRLPATLPGWERRLAQGVQYSLYALMLILPLTGWAMLTARHAPISFWGLPWPAMPGVLAAAGDHSKALGKSLKSLHVYWLIWVLCIATALHFAGAVLHQFDGNPVLWRMWPFLRPGPDREAQGGKARVGPAGS